MAKVATLRLLDGTVWPDPADPHEVEWRLRHTEASRGDVLVAAWYMEAYRALVRLTQKRRNEVCRQLKQERGE